MRKNSIRKNLVSFSLVLVLTIVTIMALSFLSQFSSSPSVAPSQKQEQLDSEEQVVSAVVYEEEGINFAAIGGFLFLLGIPVVYVFYLLKKKNRYPEKSVYPQQGRRYSPKNDIAFKDTYAKQSLGRARM